MPDWPIWSSFTALLLARGLLAASESALNGTSNHRAQELAAESAAGRRVLRRKKERESTTAAIRFGMSLFGFSAALLMLAISPRVYSQLSNQLNLEVESTGRFIGTLLAIGLATALLASLVDVLLRAVASANPERWAMRLSGFLGLWVTLLYPILKVTVGFFNLLLKPIGAKVRFEAPPPPLDELEQLLEAQAEEANVDKSAPQLIRSVFELSDKTCRDVMVARTEVAAVEMSSSPESILQLVAEHNHSRMPVYNEEVDEIVGILHVRDLIPMLQHPNLIVLKDLIRPAHFVPWMKPIGDLLREMQLRKIHIAAVVDEYGGFMGVVTLEDILREIVGDISDEFEVEVKQVERQVDGSFIVDASMETEEFASTFGVGLPDGEYETVGGFLSTLAGSIPEVGERFMHDGWQFVVHSKSGPRVARVRLNRAKLTPPRETPQEPVNDAAMKTDPHLEPVGEA